MNLKLRKYQISVISELRKAYSRGAKAPLMVAPTGAGKTVMFAHITEGAAKKGKRIMILVHRQELLMQCSRALDSLGVGHGLIAPGHTPTIDNVQVASVQTLIRRLNNNNIKYPDLIIIDEGHHAVAGSWIKIITYYSRAKILGVTATPIRLDGKGLGQPSAFYDTLVSGPTTKELISQGFLSKPIVYAPPSDADFTGLRTKYGDYDKSGVVDIMDKPTITGDAVQHYRRICPGSPAIVFAASVKHAQHVAEEFSSSGIPAESIDGKLNDTSRRLRIEALADGKIKVLTSCDIISEGTDIPVVTTAILLRPTQSLALFMQQCGRCLRPYPGKENSFILDHVGNVFRHGLPDEDRDWELTGDKFKNSKKEADLINSVQCVNCYAFFNKYLTHCPQCGAIRGKKERTIKEVEGELKKIEENEARIKRYNRRRQQSNAKTIEELLEIARERGYNKQWAYHIFNARKRKKAVV